MKLEHWQILNGVTDEEVAVFIDKHPTTVGKYHRGAIPGKDAMRMIYIFTSGVVQPNDFYNLSLTNLTKEELNYVKIARTRPIPG